MARNCMITISSARAFLWITKAAMSVMKRARNMTMVAIMRVLANIFLHWLTGPMRKHVLLRARIFPKV